VYRSVDANLFRRFVLVPVDVVDVVDVVDLFDPVERVDRVGGLVGCFTG
jgi:hypothetical protein